MSLFSKLFPAGIYPIFDPAAAAKLSLPLALVIEEFRRRNYCTIQIRIKCASASQYLTELKALPEQVWSNFYWLSNDFALGSSELAGLPEEATNKYIGCHIGWEDLGKRRPNAFRIQMDECTRGAKHLDLPRTVLGLSTHNQEHIAKLTEPGGFAHEIDYIGFGPFRVTTSKVATWPITGVEGLRKTLEAKHELPVAVIGGMRSADVMPLKEVAQAAGRSGADVIPAMISALLVDIEKK